MAEKKGLLGRWFGRKDEAPDPEEPTTPEIDPSPDPGEPEIPPDPEPTPTPEPPGPEIPPQPEPPAPPQEPETPDEITDPPLDDPEAKSPAVPDTEEPVAATEVAPLAEPAPVLDEKPKKRGLFSRLSEGLSKTSAKLTGGITGIFTRRKLDDETLEELEDLLITADLGVPATTRIITALTRDKYDKEVTDTEVRAVLAREIEKTLGPLEQPLDVRPELSPHIILVVGVNGAGKTTTIGKLSKKFSDAGHKVLLAAGDTFRAAAIEQLAVWGERTGAPVVTKPHGADAAGLAFDAIERAKAEGRDVVLIDTAGRLQNRRELMDELAKIVRVIRKLAPDAPHDTLLVLDATVGQNALSQAQTFTEIAGVTGLVMTKLDGTARGGVLVALGDKFGLPIHCIGVGESAEDLQPFKAADFAAALTAPETDQ